MKQEILKREWEYTFYKEGEYFYLSVLCGSVALYDLIIQLDSNELLQYHEDGQTYLNKLVEEIRNHPSCFIGRSIL